MTRRRMLTVLSLPLSMLVSAGCSIGPDYQTPQMTLPSQFDAANQGGVGQASAESADLTLWWKTFGDDELCSLISRAIEANLDLQLAQARVREARGGLELAVSSLFPTIEGNASLERSRTSDNVRRNTAGDSAAQGTRTSSLYHAGFDAVWELDLFASGRAIEAAQDTVEAQEAARRSVLVTLMAEVARNYITLRGLQEEMVIARRNVDDQRETLELQRQRETAGVASELSVAQAEAQLKTTESLIPQIQSRLEQTIRRLAVLLNRTPAELFAELSPPGALPVGPKAIPAGLPSDLLKRRPDIAQAERELAAATAAVGEAMAEYFPKFTLTGKYGIESNMLRNLTDGSSRVWAFGPGVTIPIFEAGRIQANVHIQEAQLDQAALKYRQTVLQALEEVENGLNAYNQEQMRRDILRDSVLANRRALELARQLNNAGLVDFLNVLAAQASLSQSENELQISEVTVSTNLVALYKALGGGWETVEPSDQLILETPEQTSGLESPAPQSLP